MKYFLDLEFNDRKLELISLALVSEDHRKLYRINEDFSIDNCSEWVKKNVIKLLPPAWETVKLAGFEFKLPDERYIPLYKFKSDILRFIGNDTKPVFIGYYCDYDWVIFCHLFGAMIDLPGHFPMYCRDLKQWVDDVGNPDLPTYEEMGLREHDSLDDALAIKYRYDWLKREYNLNI